MASHPNPLPAGFLLNDRFEVESVLGRGGFGIVYRTSDRRRGDEAVVKELVPDGARRRDHGMIELPEDGARLRERFLDEARTIARVNVQGVLPIRAAFAENGTAYYASEYLPNARTLENLIAHEGRMDAQGALDLFFQLLETLEAIHAKGVLHRDVKPSNVLVTESGTAYLIDFGAAREWHADALQTQTIVFTPGYAPPEQLSDKARRGPATDIYGLCATLYHMLAGQPPLPATDRLAGVPMRSLRQIRPDVEEPIQRAVESGLELRYVDRPQTASDLRAELGEIEEETAATTLATLDSKLVQLRSFTFERRACPSCGGLLVEPKPLRPNACPVCRAGIVRKRELHDNLCPVCASGALRRTDNSGPLAICPTCRVGRLATHRKTLLSRQQIAICEKCEAQYELHGDGMTDDKGQDHTFAEWLGLSGRSPILWICDGCSAQFDELRDGRLQQTRPAPRGPHRALYPDEWGRVALGLDPGAGNAECDACAADYYVDGDWITLLSSDETNAWVTDYLGRRLSRELVRWLAVGKQSPNPGLVCDQCGTELDRDGEYLRLVATNDRRLRQFVDQPKKLDDWHRLGRGLPERAEEADFEARLDDAIGDSYVLGELGFDGDLERIWRGPARRLDDDANATLSITTSELVFGGMLRKWRVPLDAVLDAWGDDSVLRLRMSGEDEEIAFEIEPVELVVQLQSGERTLLLDAARLAARIRDAVGEPDS